MKSDVFSHYILTRYNTQNIDGLLYDKPGADEWMDSRIELFEATKESVLSQEGDFEWIISLDPRTPKRYVKKIATDDRIKIVECAIKETFRYIKPVTSWVITSRLDNDDLYLPGAIKAIQGQFGRRLRVIDIKYEQYRDRETQPSGRTSPNSPFLSLVEPSDRIMTCYCRPHTILPYAYPSKDGSFINLSKRKIDSDVYAYMVIHDNNFGNYWLD